MRKNLEVTGKPLTYATRRMLPGDTFCCAARDARILLRMGRAREARAEVELPPPPAELLARFDHDHNGLPGGCAAPEQTDDLKVLRAEYTEKLGKRPFPGWGAEELKRRIAEA